MLAARNINDDERRPEIASLSSIIPYKRDGLVLLGTEACSDHLSPLYLDDEPAGIPLSTQTRISKALDVADATLQMIKIAPPAAAKQAGFTIARCVIAHALDFDAGVLPCSSLLPHAGVVDEAVGQIAAACLDESLAALDPDQRMQMRLPTRLAGLQLDQPTHVIPMARAACLIETGPRVRAAIAGWFYPEGMDAPEPERYDGVDQAVQGGILEELGRRGIAGLGGGGRPCQAGEVVAVDPLRPSAPDRHLLSSYLRHSAKVQYNDLLARTDDSTRLLSAAGPTAGSSITAALATPGVHYNDAQWTAMLRMRLGLSSCVVGTFCRNERASDGKRPRSGM